MFDFTVTREVTVSSMHHDFPPALRATDSLQNESHRCRGWSHRLGARREGGYLPNVPFSMPVRQLDIPFCIDLESSTQIAMLDDIMAVWKASACRNSSS